MTDLDRLLGTGPPLADPSLERALIGELLNGADIAALEPLLGPTGDVFADPFHAHIWQASLDLWRAGKPVDADMVRRNLNGHTRADSPGRLLDLVSAGTIAAAAPGHARELAELHRRRELAGHLRAALARLADGRDPDLTALLTPALPVGEVAPGGWARIDLAPALTGDRVAEVPTMMLRVDGHALLYPGRVHDFHGEPESGKSFVAQIHAVTEINAGHRVLYLDYETDEGLIVSRLLALGADPDRLLECLDYRRPETAARAADPVFSDILTGSYTYAVIDGVTDSIGLSGGSVNDNDDIARWRRTLPDALARATGAAVVMIDHVTKNTETRGRYAIGGQAKLAGISGASYAFEVVAELGQGLIGELSMRVGKDRPGGVRPHCGRTRASDRTQEAARIVVDSRTPGVIVATVNGTDDTVGGPVKPFYPTYLMAQVSAFLAFQPGASAKAIELGVKGRTDAKRTALGQLAAAGYVIGEEHRGRGGGFRYRNLTPFLEGMNPATVGVS